MEMKYDVFLAHNSKDKPIVRQLKSALQQAGLSTWIDEENLVPGQPWVDGIEQGLTNSKVIAVVVGSAGLGPWELPEMRAALIQMVRRKAGVIPVLVPGAPEQVELPLFLQTLTWIDCRDGFDSSLVRFRQAIDHAPVQVPIEPQKTPNSKKNSQPGAQGFGAFADKFLSSLGTAAKVALFLPILPILVGLQPPWDAASTLGERSSIGVLTLIIEIFALTAAFVLLDGKGAKKIRWLLWTSLITAIVSFLVYLSSFLILTELQPESNNRLLVGLVYSESFSQILGSYNGDVGLAKMDIGYDTMRIYQPWSIWASFGIILVSWLVFFSSLVVYLSSFVRSVEEPQGLTDDRALVVLKLTKEIRQILHVSGYETVGDLCAANERQLLIALKDSQNDLKQIIDALSDYGIQIRQSG